MTLLSVDRLTVAFRRYQGLMGEVDIGCLSDLTLEVARGEMVAVFGASGAGKSLFAHAVLGLLPPNAVVTGSIRFSGERLDAARIAQLRGRRIALVPQSLSHLDPLATVGRQIGWAAKRVGRKGFTREDAVAALNRFGLDELFLDSYPHTLSGGMARRVMLAIASVGDPDLVIADEPTNGLDPVNAEKVFGFLRGFADDGKGVVVISHDLAAAVASADRVAVLRDGALVATEQAATFMRNGGEGLTPYARALWGALPQHAFRA
ncbi:putative ABC transporter ATP-binding protein YejF [Pleomorphomonas sp. T1.2MG-36]|uniref:ATP-binding cassette domain-containing protein n=1 Tax=Pleomorphomonas sp. T1.2MG-36 TaxID=3041167 RepID=UPI0024777EED|nr:ATP-binding cassette domain-containing protein [Pleomorphomonas sp. T1.2MG-36]CAI9404470.1 putative ABC transporter ATP-binding protein YejF [Pleomorphomonas sp. T1.2MG-36]